ncbi:MAG: hypothetical protein Unbinned1322contig1000_45 [Prokaryotic dsDNA virus sp.]|nr:hypothetical protein [Aequorivita sp.]QDP57301.1 MAG: hypothetical protein Unbinned1322contig1000_45 [Prokaryotic dsDNA virus sp.]|tara:strand:- start:25992 stop:26252 length:261 start_codon:yes stop_codon:yes gene_type:complete
MQLKLGLELIGNIVLKGMELWSVERKKAFQKKHFNILEELDQARNRVFPEYTDIDVALAEEKYENFLEAYHLEMSAATLAREGQSA